MNPEVQNGSKTAEPASPPKGRRLTVILAVVGFIVVLCPILFLLAMSQGFKGLARTDCRESLRQIGLCCREYAAAHNGKFPSAWVELNLVGENAGWAQLLRCPWTGHEVGIWTNVDLWADYRLIAGRSTSDPPGTVLAIEPLANHGSTGANVLFVDGSVQWWPAARIAGRRSTLK